MGFGETEAGAWSVREGGTRHRGSGHTWCRAGAERGALVVESSPGFKNAVGLRKRKCVGADICPLETWDQLSPLMNRWGGGGG